LFLWVGRAVPPQAVQDLFDRPSLDALLSGKATLPVLSNPFNQRVNAIIGKLREDPRRSFLYPELIVVKEEGGDPLLRLLFLSHMIEDRQDIGPSYPQFLNEIRERIQKGGF
jgi:protein transport protein SEC24